MGQAATNFLLAFVLSIVFMYLFSPRSSSRGCIRSRSCSRCRSRCPSRCCRSWLFGQSLNIYTALGLLVLFGVVKKNAILQIDHTIALRAQGMARDEAILTATAIGCADPDDDPGVRGRHAPAAWSRAAWAPATTARSAR
jgi:HAE1 family hydrophobic/amphiphilic exporter-1